LVDRALVDRPPDSRVKVAVVGASGYAGAELVRLLSAHPRVELAGLFAHSSGGKRVDDVLPSLAGLVHGTLDSFDPDRAAERAEVAFTALPHGASAKAVSALLDRGVRVLDLSADFRLDDPAVYAEWYGEHGAPARFGTAIYGLCELHREEVRGASFVAVPGCYPTASILALAPLLAGDLIERGTIVVDAKSGVSGAGRTPTASTHFSEAGEGIRAYKSGGTHRHTPEIEQELSRVAGEPIRILFTPHLVPMTRGILASAYARAKSGATAELATEKARELYRGSPSVAVLDPGSNPDTTWVRGSNRAHVAYALDRRTGLLFAQCTLDNLVKGAAGQAVQCLNLTMGWDEGLGVSAPAVWP
jgi:N-acetyl-gamma-glutamyl-phosphate reductase